MATAFEQAVQDFNTSLTSTEKNDFKFTNLQDVYDVIGKIQHDQSKSKTLANLNRIKPFLDGMEQYGKVIEVFLNTSSTLAFVWVANNMAESFDRLLDAYEMLGESIPQFQQYEQIFNEPRIQKVLVLVYKDILDFHRRAMKIFKNRDWKSYFRSTWKSFQISFQKILDDLERHKGLLTAQASLTDFEEAKRARTLAESNFRILCEAERRNQVIAVTKWLDPPDCNQDQERFTDIRNLYPGTARWLLKDADFEAWYNPLSANAPVLWLYGIPGAGKTILASLVVEEAKKLQATSVCFFYCKYGDKNKNSFNSIARSMLSQLLHQHGDLLSFTYDKLIESGEVTLKSTAILEELLRVALSGSDNLYIIIDGLDECEKAERGKILVWFKETVVSISGTSLGAVRVLFISRDEGDINKRLSEVRKKRIDSKDNYTDMEAYLQAWSQKIQQKFQLSDSTKCEIASKVLDRADGMFLFSYLVMDNLLNQTTLEELERELQPDMFPAGLQQAYTRVVERIYNNPIQPEKVQAKKILGWLVCSKRPLKWYEIQGAISINPQSRRLDPKRRLSVDAKHLCGSLVEVQDETVELVHATAKFHLTDMGLIDAQAEHMGLALVCMQYLTFDCFNRNISDSQVRDYVLGGEYSFQDYAVVYWIEHLGACAEMPNRSLSNFDTLADHARQLLDMYWTGLGTSDTVQSKTQGMFQAFRGYGIFEHLIEVAAERSIPNGLKSQIQRARSALEQFESSGNDDLLTSFYGVNWFKCEVRDCRYYYKGFQKATMQQWHLNQHKRSFCCKALNCHIAEHGFPSRAGLQKHQEKYHSTVSVSFPGNHTTLQQPPVPEWLILGLATLQKSYVQDSFQGMMEQRSYYRKCWHPVTHALLGGEFFHRWRPRIRCSDCPGKLYKSGPRKTVDKFLTHLHDPGHRFVA